MVITGSHAGGLADEDVACADYLEGLVRGQAPCDEGVVQRVLRSKAAQKFRDPGRPEFSPEDLDCAVDVDRFAFAMLVRQQRGRRVMNPVSEQEIELTALCDGTR